jgi:hypothetical protein
MAFGNDHELHQRRFGKNMGVLLSLLAFVAVIFGITVAKISNGALLEAFDHQPRASELPITETRP